MTKALAALAGVLSAVLLLSACGSTKQVDFAGTVADFTIAKGELTTDAGKPFQLATDTTGPLTLVFFGYTHCPDICPTVLSSVASGLAKLSPSQQKEVRLLFVTSDPKRDTGPVLRSYLSRFNPGFTGLTGDLTTIATIGKSIGIFVDEGQKLSSGGYDPNSHSSYVIGVDNHHRGAVFWSGDTAPSQFAHDIRFLLEHGTDHLTSSQG
ncbi:MAG: SCO family protein [Marmoricola sp.]